MNTNKNIVWFFIIVFGVLILMLLLSWRAYDLGLKQIAYQEKQLSKTEVKNEITPTPTKVQAKYYYKVEVSTKNSDVNNNIIDLKGYIAGLLNIVDLNDQNNIYDKVNKIIPEPFYIEYSKRRVDKFDAFNNAYYFGSAVLFDTDKIYENNDVKVVLSKVDNEEINYIKDNRYCEKNSDCTLRYSICTDGAYNKYEPYIAVFGCERWMGEDGTDSDFYFRNYKCEFVNATYLRAECLNNRCIAQGKTISCSK